MARLFASVLIANRGEIARRVMRTARRMGMRTIAVYSAADAAAAHVREADAARLIGPPPAAQSYLDGAAILAAARETGAEAIHPGYGFLSENADFAQAVIDAGLAWIGPPPSAIRAMGRKDEAKRLMAAAGVAVTPGWQGEDQSDKRLAAEAARIGWPVLIKAVAGGGGRGIRRADDRAQFAEALAGARREAAAAFGDDRVLIEKLIERPRHIEVQVFADAHGGVVHLFERDCSLQRRRQKVIEEAPAPGLEEDVRQAICGQATAAAQAVGYRGAGTVEFIADAAQGLRAERTWFMEMNTRLQVEHPVTEAITGLDLVEWQFRVAAGEPLPLTQENIERRGWAMEARLYAEDPAAGFRPSTGRLTHLVLPSEIRIDSGFEEGDSVGAWYDAMLAKLIVHGETREAARAQLAKACGEVEVWPVKSNAAFLVRCLDDPDFVAGRPDTGLIERRLEVLTAPGDPPLAAAAACLADRLGAGSQGPWRARDGWRLNGPPRCEARLWVDGEARTVEPQRGEAALRRLAGEDVLFADGQAYRISLAPPPVPDAGGGGFEGVVRSPMPGRIVQIGAAVGERVSAGRTLVVLEAMKMEYALAAPREGVVRELPVKAGDQVSEGAILVRMEPEAG